MFPNATDPTRGSLYIVDLDSGSEKRLLTFLDDADAVEFAEPEVRPKQIG